MSESKTEPREAKAKEAWLTWFDTNPRAKRMDRDAYIAGYLDGFRAAGEGFTREMVTAMRNQADGVDEYWGETLAESASIRDAADRIEALLAPDPNAG